MKVIVKKPNEQYGQICEIDNDLGTLQSIVGGYIEAVTLTNGICIICNEEGKLQRLKPNMYISEIDDVLVGTIIVCGDDGEDFSDIEISLEKWEEFVDDMRYKCII